MNYKAPLTINYLPYKVLIYRRRIFFSQWKRYLETQRRICRGDVQVPGSGCILPYRGYICHEIEEGESRQKENERMASDIIFTGDDPSSVLSHPLG